MATQQKSYKHKSIPDKEMVKAPYERARDSDLKTRDDFQLSHKTTQNWYKNGERKE